MNRNTLFYTLFAVAIFVAFGFGLPEKIEKKVIKEVSKVFEIPNVAMKSVVIAEELKHELPTKLTSDNFYRLVANSELLGYAFVDKAPSKTAQFDYLVLLDTDLKVIHSKVLVYREEYGGEIGSKRWLKQFLGMSGKDRVDHETNIDGIAGATISVRSMTNAMDNLLQTIGILQENKAL